MNYVYIVSEREYVMNLFCMAICGLLLGVALGSHVPAKWKLPMAAAHEKAKPEQPGENRDV